MKSRNNIFGKLGCFFALMLGCSIGITSFNNVKGSANETMVDEHFVGYSGDIDKKVLHDITRLPNHSNDVPAITILVHGQSGDASHFSNGLYEEENDLNNGDEKFVYEQNSIGDLLSTQLDYSINIYLAKFDEETNEENDFFLYDLNPNRLNPNEDNNFGYSDDNKITKIVNVAYHSIIYFQSANPTAVHRVVYEELHTLIDKISYDYLVLTGKIPKVNLVSHSRGGLISMMYATGYKDNGKTAKVQYKYVNGELIEDTSVSYVENSGMLIHDHPFNVAELYSIGTPYSGTSWDTNFGGVAHQLLPDSFRSESARNILDTAIQDEMLQCWKNAIMVNPKLMLHTIAGEMKMSFLPGLLAEDYATIVSFAGAELIQEINKYVILLEENNILINEFISTIELSIIGVSIGTTITFPVVGGILTLVVAPTLTGLLETSKNLINRATNKIATIRETGTTGAVNAKTIFSLLADLLTDIIELCEVVEDILGYVESNPDYNLIESWGDLFIDKNSQLADVYGDSNITRYSKVFQYFDLEFIVENGEYSVGKANKNFEYKKSIDSVGIPHNLETHDRDIIDYILHNIKMGVPQTICKYIQNDDGTVALTDYEIPEYYVELPWKNVNINLSLTEETCGLIVSKIGNNSFAGFTQTASILIPDSVTIIGEGAFAGCDNLNINVDANNANYSVQGNILYNKTQTKIIATGDISANITIPTTVAEIGAYAFSENSNIEELHIYGTPIIGDYAFFGCENLEKAYFYSYTVPTMGTNTFLNDEFTLYVPNSSFSAYQSEFVGYTSDITSIPIVVTFMVDGEVYQTLNTYYGANIVGLTDPFKEGYTFNYWVDNNGNTYQNGGIWDSTENLTVEADWTARQCYINFVGYGTDGLEDKLVTYDQAIGTLPTPNTTGPVFIGWKDENDTYYYADTVWKRTNNLTLIADYEGEEVGSVILYYVDLDQDGGEGGSDNVKAEYMAAMPVATAPTRIGYTFQGYYTGANGNGVKYYNADMSSARNWGIASDKTLYAYWVGLQFTVTLKAENSSSAQTIAVVDVTYGSFIPTDELEMPTKTGYTFKGYYDDEYKQYIQPNMESSIAWDKLTNATLYADWEKNYYDIMLNLGYTKYNNYSISIGYGDTVVVGDYRQYVSNRIGYDFQGFYSGENGTGTKYFGYEIVYGSTEYCYQLVSTNQTWDYADNGELYAYWTIIDEDFIYEIFITNVEEESKLYSIRMKHGTDVTITAPTIDGYIFERMKINNVYYTTSPQILENVQLKRNLGYGINGNEYLKPCSIWYPYINVNYGGLSMEYQKEESCVAEGTLITLADGRQVPVETLTGNEMLLVWNFYTGRFDTAPILFIDHETAAMYKIINLYFSDGTHVKVIDEHAFWDFNLNKYVFLREDANRYIGHWFNKQTTDANGNMIWTKVRLTNVTITKEYTTAWSPVTYGHLCIYVNGMLSMPGATEGLINIFDVDGRTMQINQEQYLADIATYGLFTYEEFAEIYPIPEEMFNAVDGQYLKVSIGKGLIDYEDLGKLIERYSVFFE